MLLRKNIFKRGCLNSFLHLQKNCSHLGELQFIRLVSLVTETNKVLD